MKNRKIMSLIAMLLCAMLMGTSIAGCGSTEKKSEKRSSGSKSEKSDDDEEDSEEEDDSEDEKDSDDDEDFEDENDSDDEDDSKDMGKEDDEDDLSLDSGFAVSGVEINKIDPEDFKSTVIEILDGNEEDFMDDYGMVLYIGEDCDKYQIEILECDTAGDAKEEYIDQVGDFSEFKTEGTFEVYDNYIVFDAVFDDGRDDFELYGGIYISGTSVINVFSANGKDSDKEVIESILSELDLPKP